jgi:hypothetical protein
MAFKISRQSEGFLMKGNHKAAKVSITEKPAKENHSRKFKYLAIILLVEDCDILQYNIFLALNKILN